MNIRGRFYVHLQSRRTGFSREGGITTEGYLANVLTSSRLKRNAARPVLRNSAVYVGANSFANVFCQTPMHFLKDRFANNFAPTGDRFHKDIVY